MGLLAGAVGGPLLATHPTLREFGGGNAALRMEEGKLGGRGALKKEAGIGVPGAFR